MERTLPNALRTASLALAAVLVLNAAGARPAAAAAPQVGELAPPFQKVDAAGKTWSLAQLQKDGKTTMLLFWALRCAPCLREMAFAQELYQQYAAKGLTVLGVESDRQNYVQIADILDKLKNIELDPRYPIVADLDGSVTSAYGLEVVPATYVINSQGIVIARLLDFSGERKQELTDVIEGIFLPPKPKSAASTSTSTAATGETGTTAPAPDEAPSLSGKTNQPTDAARNEDFEKSRYFADFYFNRQEYDKALIFYLTCINLNPRNVYIRLKTGELYAKRKEITKAREQWEEVLRLDPGNKEADDNIRKLIRGDF